MPLWTHKVLVIPFLPVGFCLTALLLSLLFRRRWPTARWLGWTGLAVLTLSSLNIVSNPLLRLLEDAYPPIRVPDCPPADAVVVLGGNIHAESPAAAIDWNEAADRFQRGVELIQAGKAPFLVFTAAAIPWRPTITEGSLLRDEAIRRGIPPQQIVLTENLVENTSGEAAELKSLMTRRAWRRIILVTSAFHMRRSMRLMRAAGVNAIPFPADYLTHRQQPLEAIDFLPQAESVKNTEIVARETIGLLFYITRGR